MKGEHDKREGDVVSDIGGGGKSAKTDGDMYFRLPRSQSLLVQLFVTRRSIS